MTLEAHQDKRVTATLIAELKKQIASGRLAPGDRFPPERELAQTFKVNRASMRQALKVLENMGVLTQRVGDGTYLSNSAETLLREPLNFLVLLDNLSYQDLCETRLIVEPELSARAAERATVEDLAALRLAIAALKKSKTSRERLTASMSFYDTLYRASGNRICHLLLSDIQRILLAGPHYSAKSVTLERSLHFAFRVHSAIRARNPEQAREAMREWILASMNASEKSKASE